jgi:lipoic acid synthetase
VLRVRWLGKVRYQDAQAVQHALFTAPAGHDWLLLLEHQPVYTMGVHASLDHVLVPPETVGAELVRTNRGGDVTYHGPGQVTGYPILTAPMGRGSTPAHVAAVEQLVIDALADLGLPGAGRLPGYPGVWVDPAGANPRKICAIGIRHSRGRTMHGFALNVDPDLAMFGHIIPCGIPDKAVTSLAAEGIDVSMRETVDALAARATARWGGSSATERQDVAWRVAPAELSAFTRGLAGRLLAGGLDPRGGRPLAERKPEWVRVKADLGPRYRELRRTVRALELVTVCEEAGCPNIFECWRDGTATFMINGDRCTRACGFCLVDTRRPQAPDKTEPGRVAAAVGRLGVQHAVVTAVARDDLVDGGASGFAATIASIREQCPGTAVEVLIPDCRGEPAALDVIFAARPDVLNHNLETVARLQRIVRPSASYARSLAVLARAAAAGLRTKSGIIVGMGETDDEVLGALADLRGVGVSIVTIGQYLRPTEHHLPVQRWVTPAEFDHLRSAAKELGFDHVEASPLTRSSYHARQAASGVPA